MSKLKEQEKLDVIKFSSLVMALAVVSNKEDKSMIEKQAVVSFSDRILYELAKHYKYRELSEFITKYND